MMTPEEALEWLDLHAKKVERTPDGGLTIAWSIPGKPDQLGHTDTKHVTLLRTVDEAARKRLQEFGS